MSLRALSIKRHITRGRWGTEENVKIKIVLPLLEALGWDVARDCYFEEHKADILVEFEGKPALIVETKGWNQDFHYGQGLEYSVKIGTPWIVFSSGRLTEIHHALMIEANLLKPKPLHAFAYEDLSRNPDALAPLISLDAFKNGFPELDRRLRAAHPSGLGGTEASAAYERLRTAIDFDALAREQRSVDLDEALKALAPGRQDGYRRLIDGLQRLSEESDRLRFRATGLAFNLEAIDAKRELVGRLKWLGLLGVFPDRNTISKGLANWKALGLDASSLEALKRLKPPEDAASASAAIELVRACLARAGIGQ